jgi:hypothetical protein
MMALRIGDDRAVGVPATLKGRHERRLSAFPAADDAVSAVVRYSIRALRHDRTILRAGDGSEGRNAKQRHAECEQRCELEHDPHSSRALFSVEALSEGLWMSGRRQWQTLYVSPKSRIVSRDVIGNRAGLFLFLCLSPARDNGAVAPDTRVGPDALTFFVLLAGREHAAASGALALELALTVAVDADFFGGRRDGNKYR